MVRGKVLFAIAVAAMIVSIGVLSHLYLSGGQEAYTGNPDDVNSTVPETEETAPTTSLDMAPNFSLPVAGGGTVTLSNLKGRPVVLDFMATWCGPCKTQIENLNQIYSEYSAKGIVFISIDVDSRETLSELLAFRNELGATWQFAMDEDGIGSLPLYQASSIPTMVFVNTEGYITNRDVGVMSVAELRAAIDPML